MSRVNFKKNEKKYNYEDSEVYKMLKSVESEPDHVEVPEGILIHKTDQNPCENKYTHPSNILLLLFFMYSFIPLPLSVLFSSYLFYFGPL